MPIKQPTNRQGGNATLMSQAPARNASVKPVQHRLLVPLAFTMLVLVGGLDAVLLNVYHGDLNQTSQLVLNEAAIRVEESLAEQSENLEAIESVLIREEDLIVALRAQDRGALLNGYEPLFAELRAKYGITHFYFHRPDRVNLLRLHQPDRNEDLIGRFTLREAERTRNSVSGIELGPMGTFTLRAVTPVLDDGNLLGYIELGKEIEDILEDAHSAQGIEIAATINKTFVQREAWEEGMKMLGREGDWDRFPSEAVIYSSMDYFPETVGRLVGRKAQQDDIETNLVIDDKPWHALVTPLIDASGAVVGELIAMRDVSEGTTRFHRLIIASSSAAMLLVSALVVILYLALRRVDRIIVAQESLHRALVESSPDSISVLNRDMNVQTVNRVLTGRLKEDVIGHSALSFVSPEHEHALKAAFDQAFETGDLSEVETSLRQADGVHFFLHRLSPLEVATEQRVVLITTDITERKRVEKQIERYNEELEGQKEELQAQHDEIISVNASLEEAFQRADTATRAKSEFLANMSHEIRTPMTAILGFAENMLDTHQSESEKLSCVHTIRRNGEFLLGLINDILDLSKIEAGKMTVECRECQPCRIVAEVASLMRVRADGKGLPFEIEYTGSIPETIRTDPTRLRQILINLLGNAIKFTETGAVRLFTRLVDDGNAPFLQFDVTDTGRGMSDEQVAKLFQPFMQADTSTTRKFGGTGLGLTISKRFAELLGGEITVVDSELGVGTTVRATVSTGPLDSVAILEDPMSATVVDDVANTVVKIAPSDLHGLRILLAEDGPDNQRLIAFVLKKAGANVTVKENGKLAVDAALDAMNGRREADPQHPFDLILMDMQMPVMDGYEATGQLRQKGYTGPIIALTAHAMDGDRDKCIKAGCDDYATKPIDRNTLIDLILRRIQGSQPQAVAVQTEMPERPALHGCRILLAEDNTTNQVLVVGILEKAGAEITAVKDGRLALDASLAAQDDDNPFDIILMDIQMPLMGGDEATTLLREKGYTGKIIAFTAETTNGDRQRFFNMGFDDSACKPINRTKLIETIQRQLVGAAGTVVSQA